MKIRTDNISELDMFELSVKLKIASHHRLYNPSVIKLVTEELVRRHFETSYLGLLKETREDLGLAIFIENTADRGVRGLSSDRGELSSEETPLNKNHLGDPRPGL